MTDLIPAVGQLLNYGITVTAIVFILMVIGVNFTALLEVIFGREE
jgi:hypothetical protein